MIRVLWILMLIAMTVAVQAGSQFDDAKAAYDAGKLEEAKRLYEDGLRANADANMLINHGSVCFRLGNLGRAILSYERALIASPSNPDAAENLKFVRSRSGARVPESGWKEVVLSAVPRKVAPWLAMTVAWLGCLWGAVAFARRRVTGVVCGTLLLALGGTYAAGLTWMEARLEQTAIIVSVKAEARNEPADRATIAETLPAGSRVRILSQLGAWTFCDLPSGGRGWIPTSAAERIFESRRS